MVCKALKSQIKRSTPTISFIFSKIFYIKTNNFNKYQSKHFETRKSKSETVFEVRTKKLSHVPIVDFYPVDYGLPHQAFGFESCFMIMTRAATNMFHNNYKENLQLHKDNY
uniref:Fibrillar collagen NC1 domain-containing protein n=1 Tax=Timema monikensis TaxID=170555 RepID=A0A7R9HPG4_9NEOP|nr:unnamed protein product [Timema monikensis]